MFQTGIKYLGMFVDQLGVHCVEEQIDSILKLKRPENTKLVRQFLGEVNFYSSHIPYYSELLNLCMPYVPKPKFSNGMKATKRHG